MSATTADELARAFDGAFELPRPEPRAIVLRALIVRVGGVRALVPERDLVEVRRIGPLMVVPSPLDGLLGLAAFRGEIVAVLDLGAALGAGPGDRRWAALVAPDPGALDEPLALAVDAIEGLVGLEAGDLVAKTSADGVTQATRLGRVGRDALPVLDVPTIRARVAAQRRNP